MVAVAAYAFSWPALGAYSYVGLWGDAGGGVFLPSSSDRSARLGLKGAAVAGLLAVGIAAQAVLQLDTRTGFDPRDHVRRLLPPGLRLTAAKSTDEFFGESRALEARPRPRPRERHALAHYSIRIVSLSIVPGPNPSPAASREWVGGRAETRARGERDGQCEPYCRQRDQAEEMAVDSFARGSAALDLLLDERREARACRLRGPARDGDGLVGFMAELE